VLFLSRLFEMMKIITSQSIILRPLLTGSVTASTRKRQGVAVTDLKKQVVTGLKWSVLAKLITQVFSWVSTFMVIRMLTPGDYGIMAIAMVFFSLIALFTTNGLISALVRSQSEDRRSGDLIFSLSIILNLFLAGALGLSATTIASWYDNNDLVEVLWVLALLAPVTSFAVVPTARLQIAMRFKEKAIAEAVAGFSGAVVAFVGAYAGAGYWALILATVTMTIVRTVGLNVVARCQYGLTFSFRGSKELFSFALYTQTGTFIWFVSSRADMVIIGRMLGVDKAGVYNVASEVASVPMSKVNSIMSEVAFSAFARTRDDLEQAKLYLKKALRLMAVLVFPIFYGIASVSDEMVNVLLGEQWNLAGPLIGILCLILPFRMLVSVMGNFSMGMGMAKWGLLNAIVTATTLIVSIFIGATYGLKETAAAWVIGFIVVYVFLLFRFTSKFKLPLSTLLVYWPTYMVSLLMYFSVVAFDHYGLPLITTELLPQWVILISKITVGGIVAGPILLWLNGREIKALLKR
jgi:teichuronic acid exporter